MIRTGTGDIDIAAASDVQLLNPFASIYTAGTQVKPVATSILNPGGSVNLAANVPIVFPNTSGGDTITAILDGAAANDHSQIGVITYHPPVQDPVATYIFDTHTLPPGTVFTFPSGFTLPAGLPPQSTDPAGFDRATGAARQPKHCLARPQPRCATVGGIAAGVPITLTTSVVVTPSSGYTYNGQHFSAGHAVANGRSGERLFLIAPGR